MKKAYLLLFSLLSLALYSWDASITFIDRDLDWPLEGVWVQVVGDNESYYSDAQGKVVIPVSDNSTRTIILAQLPGYDSIRYQLKEGEQNITLDMVIAGVIEGKELVVEREAPGATDEEVGVSTVMEAEDLETTANVGMVEDVMSSIKTLPGVGYSGGFNAMPSIRGGDPNEMAAALDGIYITLPYHWGGAFSIFNPNMTQSAKLSHGVFSSQYGRALSGLLEVSSKEVGDEFRANISVSTTSADLFFEIPTGEKSGLFLGGKVTYMEPLIILSQQDEVTTAPYIRDFYGKWNYDPTSELSFFFNGFIGTDGVGEDRSQSQDGIDSQLMFDYYYINSFTTAGMKWSPNDKTLISMTGGFNYNDFHTEGEFNYSGSRNYSSDFIAKYDGVVGIDPDGVVNGQIDNATSYTFDNLDSHFNNVFTLYQGQFRSQINRVVASDHIVSFGIDEVFLYTERTNKAKVYSSVWDGSKFQLLQINNDSTTRGNRSLHSSAYLNWEFGSDQSKINGELGVRGEHFYIWRDHFSLHAKPTVNPRLHIAWTVLQNRGNLNSLTLSTGSGLFSQFLLETNIIDEEYGMKDFEVGPNQSFYQVIGMEVKAWDDWKFQLEGYYKYYYNRLYVTSDFADPVLEYDIHQNGYGHSVGFDLLIKKEINRYWDGYLSYSFVHTRLLNPYSPKTATEQMLLPDDEPMDKWYYPSYHRFHTANMVVNFRPANGWTITATASFASGTPKEDVGNVESFPVDHEGTVIEHYDRTTSYSDTGRTEFSIPVDLRVAYRFYGRGSKWENEIYVGVEDIFVKLYSPEGNTQFNSFTGKEEPGEADFNLGIPIPSFGYKASY